MDRGAVTERDDNIVPLPAAPQPPPKHTRPGRLHGIAIIGLAASAIVGIGTTLMFFTISWPGTTGRYLVLVIVLAVTAFLCFAIIAFFAAARDTYARHPRD